MYTFKEYEASDLDDVVKIFMANTPDYFAVTELDGFVHYLNDHSGKYYVIFHHGVTIGSGGFDYKEKENEIRLVWGMIHPAYQKMGIGKKLVEHRIAKARQMHKTAGIVVRTSQLAAGFFEKLNFKTIETEKDYWAKGLDLHIMQKD